MKAEQRANQIWPVLALAATNRQVLTYDMVARLIGVTRVGMGQLLEPIQSYCLVHRLPPLTVLVVSKDTGMPGQGFIAGSDGIPATQASVFAHDWLATPCPSPEQLESASRELPSNRTTPVQSTN